MKPERCKGCVWKPHCLVIFINAIDCPCYECIVKMSCDDLCYDRSRYYDWRRKEKRKKK